MCEIVQMKMVQNGESLYFVHTHTHTHTHTSKSCQEIFARMRKLATVLFNGGLTILTSN